jgi:hypothetical protein
MALLSFPAGTIHHDALQGLAVSFGSFASIIGLTLCGILHSLFGSITFLVSSLVIFAISILSFRLLKNDIACAVVCLNNKVLSLASICSSPGDCLLKLSGDLTFANHNTSGMSCFRTSILLNLFSFHIIHILQS